MISETGIFSSRRQRDRENSGACGTYYPRILDPQNPVDIDRLLVVTFTKAAAAEMRERIGAAIEAECEKDPQNTHLRRQSALIHNAMITTIDSFCLFVVRNHFEEISLDPNFRIADEGEIRLLEQDVLEQVFEDNYARQEKTFLSLIDAYAGKRNDHGVREMVAKIYRMSLSSPWPQAWMKNSPNRIRWNVHRNWCRQRCLRTLRNMPGFCCVTCAHR